MPQVDCIVPPRPGRACIRSAVLALCILILCDPAVAQEWIREPPVRITSFEAGLVAGILVLPSERRPIGIVVVLHDSLGPDPRVARYNDQLIGAGIGVLDVQREGDSAEALTLAIAALAADPRVATDRIGVLGFGHGARRALEMDSRAVIARALLYPGCDGIEGLPGRLGADPILLLHGDRDDANPGERCARAAEALAAAGRPVRHLAYAGAGYAWDHPLYGMERRMFLPRPDGAGRVAAAPWPELTTMSATQVAGFFASAFARALISPR